MRIIDHSAKPVSVTASQWCLCGDSPTNGEEPAISEDMRPVMSILHDEDCQSSEWCARIDGDLEGRLIEVTVDVQAEGDCLKRIGDHYFAGGVEAGIEAVCDPSNPPTMRRMLTTEGIGKNRTAATVQWFPRYPERSSDTIKVRLLAPEGCQGIIVRMALTGQGRVDFNDPKVDISEMDTLALNNQMIDALKVINSKDDTPVELIMRTIPRHIFLPDYNPASAYHDEAIATHTHPETGESYASCSQPSMVAAMLYQLDLQPGMKVMEIGTGTGYNAAIMSKLTGDPNLIHTIELDADVAVAAQENLALAGIFGVNVIRADGWRGYSECAPYDRIVVTASAHDIPLRWYDQLADEGILVVPYGPPHFMQRSIGFRKRKGKLIMESNIGCGFIRMRGENELPVSDAFELDPRWKQVDLHLDGFDMQAHLESIAFYMTLRSWPITVGRFHVAGNLYPCFGLIDRGWQAGFTPSSDGLAIWGPEHFIRQVTSVANEWAALGYPGPEKIQLVLCPRTIRLDLGPNEHRVAHEWLDYIISVL